MDDSRPDGSSRERKAYALTKFGRRMLRAELERLQKLVAVAEFHTAEGTS